MDSTLMAVPARAGHDRDATVIDVTVRHLRRARRRGEIDPALAAGNDDSSTNWPRDPGPRD